MMISKMRSKQFFLGLEIIGCFLTTSLKGEEPTTSIENSFSLSTSNQNQDKAKQLVQGEYFGLFRLRYNEAEYIDSQFRLQNWFQDPDGYSFLWETHKGTYNQLVGYWIFNYVLNQCWQAYKTNGPLVLWNLDGRARGNPEDWELFVFEFANEKRVRVKNIYGKYVRYEAPHFKCDADVSQAATFLPLFD